MKVKNNPPPATAPGPVVLPPGYPGAHPHADTYPLDEAVIRELLADFQARRQAGEKNLQLQPITLCADGRILDGRHRWLALTRLGLTPHTHTLSPKLTEAALAKLSRSLNEVRRHLNQSQQALLTLEAHDGPRPQRGGSRKKGAGQSAPVHFDQLAAAAGVSLRLIKEASALRQHGDQDLLDQVRAGTLSLKQALQQARPSVRRPAAKAVAVAREVINQEAPVSPVDPPLPPPPPAAGDETPEAAGQRLNTWLAGVYARLPAEIRELAQEVLQALPPDLQQRSTALWQLPPELAPALREFLWQQAGGLPPLAPAAALRHCLTHLEAGPAPADLKSVQRVLHWYLTRPAAAAAPPP